MVVYHCLTCNAPLPSLRINICSACRQIEAIEKASNEAARQADRAERAAYAEKNERDNQSEQALYAARMRRQQDAIQVKEDLRWSLLTDEQRNIELREEVRSSDKYLAAYAIEQAAMKEAWEQRQKKDRFSATSVGIVIEALPVLIIIAIIFYFCGMPLSYIIGVEFLLCCFGMAHGKN
jgi:hypothetical protein